MHFNNVHFREGVSIAFAAWIGLVGAVESLLFVIFRPDFGLELPGRQQAQAQTNGSNHLQSDRSRSPPIP
jgi:hypothetical protein